MSDVRPPSAAVSGVDVYPLSHPIRAQTMRQLVALDAALVDELGPLFSTERWSEKQFSLALPGKWQFSRVARPEEPSRIVGYWIASLRGGSQLHTHRVGVDAAARRSGVGRTLYTAVTSEMATRGIRAMTLSVHKGNEAAFRFYASLGFAPLVGEDLERFGRAKAGGGMGEDRRQFVIDGSSYLVLRVDPFGGTI